MAPFDRNRESPSLPLRTDGRDSQRKPYSPGNDPNLANAGPGARVNRRAADRLRAGHLWVYASDIESLETGEGGPCLLYTSRCV